MSNRQPEITNAILHRCGGRDESGVADFTTAFVKRHARQPPAVTWLEPRPDLPVGATPGPIEGFAGLWLGMPVLDGLLLDEAQLSWSNGLLRVAATEGSTRWFACSTRPAAFRSLVPDWEMPAEPAEASSYQVYLRSDLSRFLGRRTQDGDLVEPEPPPAARRSLGDRLLRRRPATPHPFRINGQVASIKVMEWRHGAEVVAWWLIPNDRAWESEL